VIMWRTISRLLLLVLIPSCASALAQDGPQTPKPNSSERKAIVNTLRAPVEKELKQKVVFPIRRLKVQNGWAFMQGVPQQPGGKPVNYRITRHQTAIEAGAFDDGILALLRKEKARWRVVVYDIGSTDYPAGDWRQKYKASPGIFR
ncbi:MAG TPA: hypothetical protein VFU08_09685, partial [Candidatus Udaeobacter sp.]|nr:hypothetical protein [Candidatus Udaeobacter sp.]